LYSLQVPREWYSRRAGAESDRKHCGVKIGQ
jgi:hypothetical protein